MTTAIVESRVKLTSVDRSSRNINKSNRALKGTARSLNKAADASKRMGGAMRQALSGDIIGGAKSLAGALGPGVGLAGTAGLATVGVAALGVAVGAAAFKFTEWSVEISRLQAGLTSVFGPDGVQKAIAISNALGGVSAESIGKVATTLKLAGVNAEFTAEQLAELTQRATEAGKTGDESLQALAAAIQKGNTRAL